MSFNSIWIYGPTRSGKTASLVAKFQEWSIIKQQEGLQARNLPSNLPDHPGILVFAANGDNRLDLGDRIEAASLGKYPFYSTTPSAFFQAEVILFWPLLIQELHLKGQFPLKLRPEMEQNLATILWRPELDRGILRLPGVSEYRLVRRTLDLFQLAAVSGTAIEDISDILSQGFLSSDNSDPENLEFIEAVYIADSSYFTNIQELLIKWRTWCLDRGLLSYGIVAELYSRYLLPHPIYQQNLINRYQILLADDVDEYPAITRDLFSLLLDKGVIGAFTFNPEGAIRWGLGADPNYMESLAEFCQIESLSNCGGLAKIISRKVINIIEDPLYEVILPSAIKSILTTSRSELLRTTANLIVSAIKSQEVQPQDLVVIAPGLDTIAHYTLTRILSYNHIPVTTLNDQRPLVSSPHIRALLTLLAFIYPGLGRLIDRDSVAEMLVILSAKISIKKLHPENSIQEDELSAFNGNPQQFTPVIDPVRAGLLADYCYIPNLDQPSLIAVDAFPRRDRLGYRATNAYQEILTWIESERQQLEKNKITNPVAVLYRAMQKFVWNGSNLPYDQLAALRELIETAESYWQINYRLQEIEKIDVSVYDTVGQFIQLLRQGTVTANPYPIRPIGAAANSVTLANIFQYRSSRQFHKWQFWLDVGSPLWPQGGAATLFGAPLFIKDWSGGVWNQEDAIATDSQRLQNILLDLLARAEEKVFLCYSDLAVNGEDQTGPLLGLVNAAVSYEL